VSFHSDEYYTEWPFKWPQVIHERQRDRPYFLVSLAPHQELAHFLFNRAVSLDIVGKARHREALAMLHDAQRLWPARIHAVWITHLTTKVHYPSGNWPHAPCEETAGKSAMDRLVREQGAKMLEMDYATTLL
jgi:hypothetical protein